MNKILETVICLTILAVLVAIMLDICINTKKIVDNTMQQDNTLTLDEIWRETK